MYGQSSFPEGFGIDVAEAVPAGCGIDALSAPVRTIPARHVRLAGLEPGSAGVRPDLRRRTIVPNDLRTATPTSDAASQWSCWSTSAAMGVLLAGSLYFFRYL
jgi:hypothetical protein